MASLSKLLTGKDAASDPDNPGKVGPTTPQGSLRPSHEDIPGVDDHVGWNAPRTPPGVDTLDEQKIATQGALDAITPTLNNLTGAVEVLAELFRQQRDREQPTFRNITLGVNPQLIRSEGRPYNAVIVSTAGGTLTVLIPGQDSYVKTLVAGWNILNVPDGTALSINSGTLNAQLVRSYAFLGNPL